MEIKEAVKADLRFAADQDPSLTHAVVWGSFQDFRTFTRYTDAQGVYNELKDDGKDAKIVNLITL